MSLAIGRTKYCTGGYIEFARYRSGEIAMSVRKGGEPQLTATVSLIPYGADHPGEFDIWIKDWSENEGVSDALVTAGIVRLTGKTHQTGYVEAKHAELTDVAKAAFIKALAS